MGGESGFSMLPYLALDNLHKYATFVEAARSVINPSLYKCGVYIVVDISLSYQNNPRQNPL